MRSMLFFLIALPLISSATEYLNNDGYSAPETIDKALEEGDKSVPAIQREEVEEEVYPSVDGQKVLEKKEDDIKDKTLIAP